MREGRNSLSFLGPAQLKNSVDVKASTFCSMLLQKPWVKHCRRVEVIAVCRNQKVLFPEKPPT